MEEVIKYIIENQMLFYVVGISIIVSAILVLAIHLLSKKKPREDYFDEVDVQKSEEIKVKPIEVHDEPVTPKSELDLLLEQMQKDMEDEKVNPVLSFEEQQEEHAIISYEELLKANHQNVLSAEEEEKQPLIMSVRQYEQMQDPVFTEMKVEEPVKYDKKFKNSEFISPVYGKINSELDYPKIPTFRSKEEERLVEPVVPKEEPVLPPITETIGKKTINTVELEKTLDLERIMEEMKRNEEFLQALKEFRKNL